jgi:hypothetical protein
MHAHTTYSCTHTCAHTKYSFFFAPEEGASAASLGHPPVENGSGDVASDNEPGDVASDKEPADDSSDGEGDGGYAKELSKTPRPPACQKPAAIPPAAPAAAAAAAMAPATGAAQMLNDAAEASCKKPNSNSHKKEYMEFVRQCMHPETFPTDLGPQWKKGKTELFQLWMQEGKDLKKVVVRVKRGMRKSTINSSKMIFKKKHQLSKDYEGKPEKVAKIIKHCEDNKLWSWDPALPNDEDEKLYLVPGERYIDFRTEGFQQVDGEG